MKEKDRPKQCRYKKTCEILFSIIYDKAFVCVGITKRPRDKDFINWCFKSTNYKKAYIYHISVADACIFSAVFNMGLAHFYELYDIEKYQKFGEPIKLNKLKINNPIKN